MIDSQKQTGGLGTFGFIAVLAGAVIAGFFGASYFLNQPGSAATAPNIQIPNNGKRLGVAEEAPLVFKCAQDVKFTRNKDKNANIDPRMVNALLRLNNRPEPYVAVTGPILLCALEQNAPAVCDADNRAMVVEGVNRFLRMAAAALAVSDDPKAQKTVRRRMSDGEIMTLRDQVLHAVERQVREGRLIKSDFGWRAHAELGKIFATTKPSRDACAHK